MRIPEAITLAIQITAIAFGIFIAYQILRIIFGGSWPSEDAILALLILNITLTVSMSLYTTQGITKIRSDLTHLTKQFDSLAADFKELQKRFNSLASDFKSYCNKSSKS